MIRDYIQLKKARKLMKRINKMASWESKIIEDNYNRKLEIKYNYEDIDLDKLMKMLSLLIRENVKFFFWYDKLLCINVDCK